MKDALVYALEYEVAISINRQQRNGHSIRVIKECQDDKSDALVSLEYLLKKYQWNDKILTDLLLRQGGSLLTRLQKFC